MAVDLAPVRHRRPTVREQNLGMELSALRAEAIATADYVVPRLDFLVPVSIELGHPADQLLMGCLDRVVRLRKRAAA